jgi:hypothetical protein
MGPTTAATPEAARKLFTAFRKFRLEMLLSSAIVLSFYCNVSTDKEKLKDFNHVYAPNRVRMIIATMITAARMMRT